MSAFHPLLLVGPESPTPAAESLDAYVARGGYTALRTTRERNDPDALLAMLTAADLRGRGGAGFPTARKWTLAREASGSPKYLVANAGEHEPGSLKDRHLVTHHPHTVLEGIALAAWATGATVAYLYLIEDMHDALASARGAIDEATRAGLLHGLDVKIQTAPTTYVAGEETAALEVIEGRKALPRKKPPYPGTAGLFGKPTTVNNVETLAHVPGIVRDGGVAYRSAGRRGAAGTMLVTLERGTKRTGVVEVPLGTTFRELITEFGHGTADGREVKAVLPALSSPFLSAAQLDVAMEHQAVRTAGSNLGCGGVSVMLAGECMVERVVEIAQFFMREQCGQCPPCRMETNTLAAVMKQVQGGTENDFRAQAAKIMAFARGKGLCSLIEMAAAPIESALRCFPDDFDAHARTGRCAGG